MEQQPFRQGSLWLWPRSERRRIPLQFSRALDATHIRRQRAVFVLTMSTLSSSVDMNPDLKDPDLYVERVPLEVFAKLRNEDPVYWNPERDGPGFWALTRHADIVHVSTQPGLFSSAFENGGHRIFNENEVGLTGAGESAIGIPFISRDPPLHAQYRKVVMPALAPSRLGGIEDRVRLRCVDLLAKIPLDESVDLVPLLSAPLPLLTLAELLDVPAEIWPKLYDWTNAFVGEDDPDFRRSPEAMGQILAEFFGFARELFDQRRSCGFQRVRGKPDLGVSGGQ